MSPIEVELHINAYEALQEMLTTSDRSNVSLEAQTAYHNELSEWWSTTNNLDDATHNIIMEMIL